MAMSWPISGGSMLKGINQALLASNAAAAAAAVGSVCAW